MKALIQLVGCICIFAVNALPQGGKRITFSTATSLDFEKIKFNDNDPEFGSKEFYESHSWIAVSSEGFEYEGTIEEIMEYMEPPASEDTGEKEPANPAINDPSNPNVAEDDTPSTDPVLTDLSNALEHHDQIVEKRRVFGADTRRKVSPPNRFPYSAIGRIDIGCTGTFIARRTVLTAGHCVHQGRGGKWYRNLNFRRCKDCDPNNGAQHTWKWAVSFKGWTRRGYSRYDIAIITVREASPASMVFDSAWYLPRYIVNIAGYPGDKPGKCLWRTWCRLSWVRYSQLMYPCDTAGGMSGSAVYVYWSKSNRRVIYGVHTYGATTSNGGTRITVFFERRIRKWINQYGGI